VNDTLVVVSCYLCIIYFIVTNHGSSNSGVYLLITKLMVAPKFTQLTSNIYFANCVLLCITKWKINPIHNGSNKNYLPIITCFVFTNYQFY